MQSYDDDDDAEEDVDVVKVFYDDDPAALQPILASLATPADPFARSIATQAGWDQQIKAVFQDVDAGDDTMKVVSPMDFEEEQLPINTLTNVCLIGEGLAHLNLSDAKTDGSVCTILAKATNDLREAVESAQTEFLKTTSDHRKMFKEERQEREEKASGFFLPIWTLMDQMKHVDMDAGDVIALSRRYVSAEIQEEQKPIDTHVLSLLNLASSNLGFHLVDRSVRRSAAFGRMNPWLHMELLRLFDRYRVVSRDPVMMKLLHATKTSENNPIKKVIGIKRVRVEVPGNIISFGEEYDINRPVTNDNNVVLMDGIQFTLKQHNNKKLPSTEQPFKTGTHAAIHFRSIGEVVPNNDEAADKRGNTLSFLYRWPEIEKFNIKTVKIVLYGSGKVDWWTDYYWSTKEKVMPYPPRRVYIADTETMIEYHDIMYLIFAQSLYGNFGDLPNSIKLVQSMFATHVSGATSRTFVMAVLESREDLAHPYPRLYGTSKPIPEGKFGRAGNIIRKFPRMRDVLLKTTLEPTWEIKTEKRKRIRKGGARGRERRSRAQTKYAGLPVQIVPRTDLIFKQTDSSLGIPNQIRLKLHDKADIESIGKMSWIDAGNVGLQNLNQEDFLNVPDQRSQELANFIRTISQIQDDDDTDVLKILEERLSQTAPAENVPQRAEASETSDSSGYGNTVTLLELAQSTKNVLEDTQVDTMTERELEEWTNSLFADNPLSIQTLNDTITTNEIRTNLGTSIQDPEKEKPESDPGSLDTEYDAI